jgi:DNA-binding CsgD family transcriptional regulator
MTREQLSIDAKHQRMLELLALGASNRSIAEKMGYQEGTMRVYLHNLYKKIGVANKTEAVVWYLGKGKAQLAAQAAPVPVPQGTDDVLGDFALGEGLYATLGVMSSFIGPYSRVWEIGQRLSGTELTAESLPRRVRSRQLWKALLEGEWAFGKRLFDSDETGMLRYDSPSDAVILALLLGAGGYTSACEKLAAQLNQKRKSGASISAREAALIAALPAAFEADDREALAGLQRLTTERGANALVKQLALALVFHACRARKDYERARRTAHALWGEAESARQQLRAMGDRTFGAEPSVAPSRAPREAAVKEKAALAR